MLSVTCMATMRNLELVSGKFNVVGTSNGAVCDVQCVTKLYDYQFIVLVSLGIQPRFKQLREES
jgi:hypothetical protein